MFRIYFISEKMYTKTLETESLNCKKAYISEFMHTIPNARIWPFMFFPEFSSLF